MIRGLNLNELKLMRDLIWNGKTQELKDFLNDPKNSQLDINAAYIDVSDPVMQQPILLFAWQVDRTPKSIAKILIEHCTTHNIKGTVSCTTVVLNAPIISRSLVNAVLEEAFKQKVLISDATISILSSRLKPLYKAEDHGLESLEKIRQHNEKLLEQELDMASKRLNLSASVVAAQMAKSAATQHTPITTQFAMRQQHSMPMQFSPFSLPEQANKRLKASPSISPPAAPLAVSFAATSVDAAQSEILRMETEKFILETRLFDLNAKLSIAKRTEALRHLAPKHG